jgi:molybdopterin-guanine dinucleotide biosynthesis protein A
MIQPNDPSILATGPTPNQLIGIVLAGGQSSRMGQDKALLTFRGKTLLSIAEQTLMEAGCGRVLMSGSLRPGWHGQHIPDLFAHLGPVGGMVSCIEALAQEQSTEQNTEHHLHPLLVFVAVDTPLLLAQTLSPLITPLLTPPLTPPHTPLLAAHVDPTVDPSPSVIGARYAHHPIPLVLRLTPSVYAHAQTIRQQLIIGQSCSVNAFTEPFMLTRHWPDDAQSVQLRNINTPEDWSQLNHEFAD